MTFGELIGPIRGFELLKILETFLFPFICNIKGNKKFVVTFGELIGPIRGFELLKILETFFVPFYLQYKREQKIFHDYW